MIQIITGAYQAITGAVTGAVQKADQEANATERAERERKKQAELSAIGGELEELQALERSAMFKRIGIIVILILLSVYIVKKK